jgi:hypothetical protein
MTTELNAAQVAWVAYNHAKHPEECPTMHPAFRRGFEDGIKYERARCCRIVTGMCESDNEATQIVNVIRDGKDYEP